MAASRRVAAGLEGSAIRELIVRSQGAARIETGSAEVVVRGAGRAPCQYGPRCRKSRHRRPPFRATGSIRSIPWWYLVCQQLA